MQARPHYEIRVKTRFSAAHHLRGYPGDCSQPHGHNWTVEVRVAADGLDGVGISRDFREVKAAVNEAIAGWDHRDLNALPEFQAENPSAENLARHLYRALSARLNSGGCRVAKVRVGETPAYSASYWENA
jgi:6-pyruvoyltetrahydropterin/6-carboxytetrahydropterin synthase